VKCRCNIRDPDEIVRNSVAAAEARRTLPAVIDGAPVDVQIGEPMVVH
jgi:hypothetical protein